MRGTPEREDVGPTPSTHWQRGADRLARYAWRILLGAVMLALLGGVISATVWQPGRENAQGEVPCENPPCFGGGGLPGLHDLPFVVVMLGYVFTIVLGVPSLFIGVWDVLHGRWAAGGRRFLPFLGPVLFFVGTEIVPHLVNPCFWALEVGGRRLPALYCAYNPEWGVDVADRWHLLLHTTVGAMPMAALYWLALRTWRPDIVRFR